MKTIKLEIELTYDNEILHGSDADAIEWFFDEVIHGDGLILHDNGVGDSIGTVKVTGVGVMD